MFCCVVAKWDLWYTLIHRERLPQTDLVRRLQLEPLIGNSGHMSNVNRIWSFCEFPFLQFAYKGSLILIPFSFHYSVTLKCLNMHGLFCYFKNICEPGNDKSYVMTH